MCSRACRPARPLSAWMASGQSAGGVGRRATRRTPVTAHRPPPSRLASPSSGQWERPGGWRRRPGGLHRSGRAFEPSVLLPRPAVLLPRPPSCPRAPGPRPVFKRPAPRRPEGARETPGSLQWGLFLATPTDSRLQRSLSQEPASSQAAQVGFSSPTGATMRDGALEPCDAMRSSSG